MTVLKNGKIVTPDGIVDGDVAIENGVITRVGGIFGGDKSAETIDCSGKYIIPGMIDVHVHFREPGGEYKADWQTESAAAAMGGVTTVFDMPNTDPPTVTIEALKAKLTLAATKSKVNFRLYMGLTGNNLDEIKKAPADIAGVKVYMGSSTGSLLVQDMDVIENLIRYVAESCVPWPVVVHAEDEMILQARLEHMGKYGSLDDPAVHSLLRPPEAAYEAVRKILHLAKKYPTARIHLTHISTAAEVEEIRKFKNGTRVSCDTTPHHLFMDIKNYAENGNFVRVNPPLRTEKDRNALWRALQPDDGTIDLIATDHAPHTREEKERPYTDAPSGIPEVQTVLPLLLDAVNHGQLSVRDVVRLTAEAPARLFNLPSKGEIVVGKDADLVVVDMASKRELTNEMLKYKCKWSPYAGWHLQGWPVITLVGGKVS